MTPERFAEVERLFDAAVVLPPEQRAAFIDAQCGSDEELRAELEALLEADASPLGARLAGAIEQAVHLLPPAQPDVDSDIGLHIGPYMLVRELGRGGMGAVYQAMRSDGEYLHTVAIKLIKRGMDTDAIVRRFRTERQILAGLSHPNIASLLDGGTTPDGRPYLVMEFIEGQTIVDYAASRDLDIRRRIELFLPICRAVEHAHQRHILHRDLKPANVMVTADGIPKLLDFGIAKLLLPELVAGGVQETESPARLLTPDYASPEQIRGTAEVTAATDVYSLGVLLYRLLAGRQPYSITGRSLAEIERAITEQTAPPPSKAATDPKIRSVLSGDLDTIIAMAMRKEPERRYGSAAALEADLERYLAGWPVHARSNTFAYRARKWTRRHGLRALATGSIVILGAIAGREWHLRRSREAPAEALDLCRRAEQLLRSDIRSTQAGHGLPEPLRQSIALWQRATEIAPRHIPAWTGLAGAAEFAIDYDAPRANELKAIAEKAAQQALQLDPNSPAAYAVRGALRFRDWNFADAASEFVKSLALDPRQPYLVADLADCENLTGRSGDALATLETGLARALGGDESHGSNVRGRVILLNALAGQYRLMQRFDEARAHAGKAIQLQRNYAPARLQMGLILEQTADLAGAEREYKAAFDMRPSDQRNAAALGHLYGRQGRRSEARQMLQSLESIEAEGTPVQTSLALVFAGLGEQNRALDALEQSVRNHEGAAPYRFLDFRLRDILETPRARALAAQLGIPITPSR